jgi:hypothetical protein
MGLSFQAVAENPKEKLPEVSPVLLKTGCQMGTSWSEPKKGISRPFLFELSLQLYTYVSYLCIAYKNSSQINFAWGFFREGAACHVDAAAKVERKPGQLDIFGISVKRCIYKCTRFPLKLPKKGESSRDETRAFARAHI